MQNNKFTLLVFDNLGVANNNQIVIDLQDMKYIMKSYTSRQDNLFHLRIYQCHFFENLKNSQTSFDQCLRNFQSIYRGLDQFRCENEQRISDQYSKCDLSSQENKSIVYQLCSQICKINSSYLAKVQIYFPQLYDYYLNQILQYNTAFKEEIYSLISGNTEQVSNIINFITSQSRAKVHQEIKNLLNLIFSSVSSQINLFDKNSKNEKFFNEQMIFGPNDSFAYMAEVQQQFILSPYLRKQQNQKKFQSPKSNLDLMNCQDPQKNINTFSGGGETILEVISINYDQNIKQMIKNNNHIQISIRQYILFYDKYLAKQFQAENAKLEPKKAPITPIKVPQMTFIYDVSIRQVKNLETKAEISSSSLIQNNKQRIILSQSFTVIDGNPCEDESFEKSPEIPKHQIKQRFSAKSKPEGQQTPFQHSLSRPRIQGDSEQQYASDLDQSLPIINSKDNLKLFKVSSSQEILNSNINFHNNIKNNISNINSVQQCNSLVQSCIGNKVGLDAVSGLRQTLVVSRSLNQLELGQCNRQSIDQISVPVSNIMELNSLQGEQAVLHLPGTNSNIELPKIKTPVSHPRNKLTISQSPVNSQTPMINQYQLDKNYLKSINSNFNQNITNLELADPIPKNTNNLASVNYININNEIIKDLKQRFNLDIVKIQLEKAGIKGIIQSNQQQLDNKKAFDKIRFSNNEDGQYKYPPVLKLNMAGLQADQQQQQNQIELEDQGLLNSYRSIFDMNNNSNNNNNINNSNNQNIGPQKIFNNSFSSQALITLNRQQSNPLDTKSAQINEQYSFEPQENIKKKSELMDKSTKNYTKGMKRSLIISEQYEKDMSAAGGGSKMNFASEPNIISPQYYNQSGGSIQETPNFNPPLSIQSNNNKTNKIIFHVGNQGKQSIHSSQIEQFFGQNIASLIVTNDRKENKTQLSASEKFNSINQTDLMRQQIGYENDQQFQNYM